MEGVDARANEYLTELEDKNAEVAVSWVSIAGRDDRMVMLNERIAGIETMKERHGLLEEEG